MNCMGMRPLILRYFSVWFCISMSCRLVPTALLVYTPSSLIITTRTLSVVLVCRIVKSSIAHSAVYSGKLSVCIELDERKIEDVVGVGHVVSDSVIL